MAALSGGVVLSASVLLGQGGTKLAFHPGQDLQVAVFVSDTFQGRGARPDAAAQGSLPTRMACSES